MKTFAVVEHNNSVMPIAEAMMKLGYTPDPSNPDILIIDHDSPPHYRNLIDNYPNSKVIIYPHGEPYMFAWDGIWEVNPRTAGYLSSNHGCAEIMRRYGYPNPIHVIGWTRGVQSEFEAIEHIERALFAPIHPLNNGYLNHHHKHANAVTYLALLEMPIELTVRHIGNLAYNGLWMDDRVQFVNGTLNGTTTEADLVVSNIGTYLSMTVAQGKPCVAFGQDYPILDGHSEDSLKYSKSWGMYGDYLRYPYDVSDGYAALEQAAKTEATAWRDKFIGEPFTKEKLEIALEAICNG